MGQTDPMDSLGSMLLVVAIAVAVVAVLFYGLARVGVARSARRLTHAVEGMDRLTPLPELGRQITPELTALAVALHERSAGLVAEREKQERIEASRRELVAFITHDLRTPLSGIVSMSEALVDSMAPDPAAYQARIRELAGQLSGMVDDLFELSKIETGTLRLSLERVSLVDVVSDAVADQRAASGDREIRLHIPQGSEVMVMADPRELARAVSNLLLNAIQHTPAGSSITVTADVVDGRPSISVADSGSGIAADEIARVFEPGWRGASAPALSGVGGETGGAGLGLAIVRGIARAHRGEVSVSNVPGGCRFDLVLPRDSAVVAA